MRALLIVLTAAVIIGREIAISALREWMAEIGERARVAVSWLGKYKTILQIVGLSMMLYRCDLFGLPTYRIGLVLTVAAAVLTLWSMVDYLRAAWPALALPANEILLFTLLDLAGAPPTISPLSERE